MAQSVKRSASTHLLQSFILRRSSTVVRVFLRAYRHLYALPHLTALLVLVGQLLHVAVCLTTA